MDDPRSRSDRNRVYGESRAAAPATGQFRAVTIVPGALACSVVKRFAKHRFLLSEAPQPPLAGCDMGGTCTCSYRKFADRRSDSRRSSDEGVPDFGFVVNERRTFGTRRSKGTRR